MAHLAPELDIRIWPEIGDAAEIEYALVWRPEPGLLASLPNLKLILSLGAGVDHILCDPQLPAGVPIVRLVDPYLTDAMGEYVALQVLQLHRRDLDYRAQQQAEVWRELAQKNAGERPVGILGFGEIGQAVGGKLAALGFPVSGWGRRERTIAGFRTYAGAGGLSQLLTESEILVCLLPLTPETTGILCARTFAAQLSAAALDVFRVEPLPPGHPFWRHPRILVTPHIAGTTNPRTAAAIVLDTIRRCEEGRSLLNQVDPSRGY
jgi:glyoxylate/hydroxypyruvate reductase A